MQTSSIGFDCWFPFITIKVIASFLPARYFEGGQQTCHQNEGGVNTLIPKIADWILRSHENKRGQGNNFGHGMRKSLQNKMLPENVLVETWEAENWNLAYSIYAEHDLGIPEAWNGLFNDLKKSTDLDKEKNIPQWFVKKIEIKLDGTSEAENSYLAYYICANYDFGALESWNGLFNDFRKSTNLDKEKEKITIKNKK